MQKPILFNIDTTNDSPFYIDKNINQGDTLAFTIKVSQGSQSLSLTGQTVHIIIKRASGYSVEMKTGNQNLSVSNNVITAVFKDDYLCTDAEGIAIGEIKLIDPTGESSTNHFHFEVKKSLETDIITKSANVLDTFIGIKNLIDSYNTNADNLATQNQLATQNKAELQGLNTNAETLANRVEKDITDGTEVAERLELDIATGNQVDSNLKQDISTGNTLHNNLLLDITNGNDILQKLPTLNWNIILSYIELMNTMLSGSRLTDGNGNYLTDGNGNYLTMA